MQNKILILVVLFFSSHLFPLQAQQYTTEEINANRCFVGSSLFMLGNFDTNEKPDFLQLNLGYRITPKDVISIELKTWRYFEPLGIPYGNSRTNVAENFPGYIREKGFAIAYQRYLWKGLYTGIHIMNAWQDFNYHNKSTNDKGFQIFNTYRLGYHIKLFKGNFFIEPSIAITHRPYLTKMPDGFKQKDDQWSKFFYGEPGFHFGYNF